MPPNVHVKAYNHLLGECGVTFFAAPPLAQALQAAVPRARSTGAPLLLPAEGTLLRRQLDDWLQQQGLTPTVVGEFDDSALMKVFGENGVGAFAAPSVIEAESAPAVRGRPDRHASSRSASGSTPSRWSGV